MTRPLKAASSTCAVGLAALVVLVSVTAPHAQQAGPRTPQKAVVPVAASSLADDPDAYYGDQVSLFGVVEQRLATSVFSVAQSRTTHTGKDVLVLTPNLYGSLGPDAQVTVIGEALRFDPDAIVARMGTKAPTLPPDVVAKYRGRPAVIATAVIDATMTDLTRRLPPPMTADEEAFSRVMNRIGPAFTGLRTGLSVMSADIIRQSTADMTQAFADTAAFWKSRGQAEPAQWALDARKQVESVAAGALSANWAAARAASSLLAQSCQTCHAAYRDRFDDGSFRVKTNAP